MMAAKKVTLFHNPRCSKSRKALELLSGRDVDLEVIEYLNAAPSREMIAGLIESSNSAPADFVRSGDGAFKDAGLEMPERPTPDAVAALLADNPAVLQRPIAVCGGVAVIGRPPERVLELL